MYVCGGCMSGAYIVIAHYKGVRVRTEYCDNWLRAETVVSELKNMSFQIDEVQMKKVEDDDAELVR
jgi:hypothetical protein